MDSLLAELVAARAGVVTVRQFREWGVHRAAVAAAVRGGELLRVGRGAYTTPAGNVRPEEAHLRRARAVLDMLPPATVLTHHSALAYWGLPTYDADLRIVHVGRVEKPSVNRASGRRWHRLRAGTPLDHEDPVQAVAVAPEIAAVQVGLSSPRAYLVAADRALRNGVADLNAGRALRGATTTARLEAGVSLHRSNRGVAGVRRVLDLADPRSESAGESLLRHDLLTLGFAIEPQYVVELSVQRRYRVDLRIRGSRVVCEYDGEEKYEGNDARERARIRVAERERERELRRLGWRIARFTKHDLGRYEVIRERVEEAR